MKDNYTNPSSNSVIEERSKLRWDRHRSIFLNFGFACSTFLVLLFINLTVDKTSGVDITPEIEPLVEVKEFIPRTKHSEPKEVKPPKKIPIEKIEKIILKDVVEEESNEIREDNNIPPDVIDTFSSETGSIKTATPPKVDVLPEEKVEEDLIFVERMPVYGEKCLVFDSEEDRRKCSMKILLEEVYDKLKYPDFAKEIDIQGTVVISFVVDKSGFIRDIEIMRDIGGGCGNETVKVIKSLGKFTPGKQNGRPVSVIYRMPVKFSLK